MEAKGRVCKICDRWFANGKAMGGHMRSHLAKLPVPAPNKPQPERSQSPTTLRSANSELSFVAAHDDMERETASCRVIKDSDDYDKILSSFQPKRHKSVGEAENVSSGSSEVGLSSDEDVAMCLLSLSVDNGLRGSSARAREAFDETRSDEEEDKDGEEDEEDEPFCLKREITSVPSWSKFRCGVCKKLFGSYRALGRHRAISHDHGSSPKDGTHPSNNSDVSDHRGVGSNQRIFKCPFCDKVFESGQGLGGHKKVHFINAAKKRKKSHVNCGEAVDRKNFIQGRLFIDLNLPAASEDHHNEEVSIQPQL